MPAPLLGITGYARSGKDTFAERLITHHGYTKASFAEPLKAAALRLDPIIRLDVVMTFLDRHPSITTVRLSDVVRELGWEAAKDEFPEVRRTLQRLGTDAIRAIDPGFWVRMAVGKLDPDVPTVFTDVRFPNEAKAITDAGGRIVRIKRAGLMQEGERHFSETSMDDYPAWQVVLNGGDVADLHAMADRIAKMV